MGDSLEAVQRFPEEVRGEFGCALYWAQIGRKHTDAKPLRGLGPGVLEVVAVHRSGALRAVCTVNLGGIIYVLHAFQKKGVSTPRTEIELVKQRLRRAVELHSEIRG